MQLAAGAAGSLVNALLHTKGKLIKIGADAGGGSAGALGKLGAAVASMSPIPIPGLGATDAANEISFMFNPTQYRVSRSVKVHNETTAATAAGNTEFLGTEPLTLEMELFFDDFASAKGDVTPKINKLFSWQIAETDADGVVGPPLIKLDWGGNPLLKDFQGVLKSVNATYTLFNRSGTPIQATVGITLEGADPPKPPEEADSEMGINPTSHALGARRVHVVVEGDTLASVANAEYGDPNYWRALAQANEIDDPLRVRPGANLLIPSAADAARLR